MKIKVLGCGPSGGVPHLVKGWGACSPSNIKNKRLRSSILVQTDDHKNILVDTSPDAYHQFLAANITSLDAVLYTHTHADHCHGIDTLRWICQKKGEALPIYAYEQHIKELKKTFPYAFSKVEGDYYYKPDLVAHALIPGEKLTIGNNEIIPILQKHGEHSQTLGFIFNDCFAYSTDVLDFPCESYSLLKSSLLHTWIIGVLRHQPHSTHAHTQKALEWAEDISPKQAFFTHMDESMDYEELAKSLPEGVYPCYDNQEIVI